jgi:hypothetical protein
MKAEEEALSGPSFSLDGVEFGVISVVGKVFLDFSEIFFSFREVFLDFSEIFLNVGEIFLDIRDVFLNISEIIPDDKHIFFQKQNI